MNLRIGALELSHFRNYDSYSLEGMANLEIFVGPNAIGKTNLLEAVHLLTSTTSFRHSQISELIQIGHDSSRISMECSDGNRELGVSLALEPGKKRYTVNGKGKSASDVRGLLPSVTFTPDDLELAKRSSAVKRVEIDDLGAQLTKNYHIIQRDYEKTVRYKNKLLKEEAPFALVEAMNETLLTCATQLFCYRHALYRKLAELMAQRYDSISQSEEPFSACYVPSWIHLVSDGNQTPASDSMQGEGEFSREEVRRQLEICLESMQGEERARKRSLVGPHNDKIFFYLSGKDASAYASQGQQRSIVLAFKLAEVEMVRRTLGTYPVLLLDDVMSELDEHRRHMLVQNVSDEIQTIITATDLSYFDRELLDKAHIVKMGR